MESSKDLPGNASIFANITYCTYRKHMHTSSECFGFGRVNVKSHWEGLGKSVEDFKNITPLDNIAVGGRWDEIQSAISYIKNGQSSLSNINITHPTQKQLQDAEYRFIYMTMNKWSALRKRHPAFSHTNNQPACNFKAEKKQQNLPAAVLITSPLKPSAHLSIPSQPTALKQFTRPSAPHTDQHQRKPHQ